MKLELMEIQCNTELAIISAITYIKKISSIRQALRVSSILIQNYLTTKKYMKTNLEHKDNIKSTQDQESNFTGDGWEIPRLIYYIQIMIN